MMYECFILDSVAKIVAKIVTVDRIPQDFDDLFLKALKACSQNHHAILLPKLKIPKYRD